MIERFKKVTSQSPLNLAGFFNFKKYLLIKLFIKGVSLLLVFSFLGSQILWAEPAAKDYTANPFSEQPFGVSPTDLTGRQDAVQSVVDNDNFLQNFNNTQPLVVNAPLSDGTIKPFNLTDIYA